jgi:DNA (cytosine-5)-methyltransferase 1
MIAVDMFAGAGGLTLGARRASFDVALAVEIDSEIIETYRRNHPNVRVLKRDVRRLSGEELLRALPRRHIDLLMGCTPCQGFCSLTLKNKKQDPRNSLVLEMARLVEETSPEAVLMENVPGLATRGNVLFSTFTSRLRSAGYVTNWWNVQMADYGVPQYRRRLVMLAGKGFGIPLPPPTHARDPRRAAGRSAWRTLRDVIYGESRVITLSRTRRAGGPEAFNWHVVRDLRKATRARLRAAFPGGMRHSMDEAFLPECHRGGYDGFRNVYMRMSWDKPSPTITAGCTTPAKGRFGHPDCRRTTISVREAALIQTFPREFQFSSEKMELVCQMIGNAVPPLFAQRLASAAAQAIRSHRDVLEHSL